MRERPAVREQYERLAPVYDRRWKRYVDASVRQTVRRLALGSPGRLLDVGCGTGTLLEAIRGAASGVFAVGVDLSIAMLRAAAAKCPSAAPLVVADAAALPFRSESFDTVVSTSSFHYWADPAAALADIARLLGPGGRLVITDWCDDYLACWIGDRVLRMFDPAHRKAYGRRECARMLEDAGFRVEEVERYKIDWLWGLMTARALWPA